jgi:hypothetical protein
MNINIIDFLSCGDSRKIKGIKVKGGCGRGKAKWGKEI